MKIGIINYGMGNLRSVQKAFERINFEASIINDFKDLKKYDKLILPGVGHFEQGMNNLKKLDFEDELKEAIIINKKHILGICLGMQLLTKFSEEGNIEGLGIINAEVKKFPKSESLKIPHMGWNSIDNINENNLFPTLSQEELVYFVHSYYVTCNNKKEVLYQSNYIIDFHAAFIKDNVMGFQFHPEKSHQNGLNLLNYFTKL